jgi:hypothetical protein
MVNRVVKVESDSGQIISQRPHQMLRYEAHCTVVRNLTGSIRCRTDMTAFVVV